VQIKAAEYLRKSQGKQRSRLIRWIRSLALLALMALLLTGCTFPLENVVPIATSTIPASPAPALSAAPTEIETCFTEFDSAVALQFAQARIATLLPGTQVTWYDSFGCTELGDDWTVGHANPTSQISVVDGLLTMRSQKVAQDWDSVGRSTANLVADQGMLIQFQFEAGTTAPLFIYVGDWQTENYLRAGLTINKDVENVWQIWEGFAFLSFPVASNVLRPDTPFYLMVELSNDGQVTMRVWERDNPNNQAVYQDRMPGLWVGRRWASMFQLQEGAIKIDEYFEYSLGNP
jgi:hypothetical protein